MNQMNLREKQRLQGELNLAGMLFREKMRQPGRSKGISKAALAREMKALFARISLLESGSS